MGCVLCFNNTGLAAADSALLSFLNIFNYLIFHSHIETNLNLIVTNTNFLCRSCETNWVLALAVNSLRLMEDSSQAQCEHRQSGTGR